MEMGNGVGNGQSHVVAGWDLPVVVFAYEGDFLRGFEALAGWLCRRLDLNFFLEMGLMWLLSSFMPFVLSF